MEIHNRGKQLCLALFGYLVHPVRLLRDALGQPQDYAMTCYREGSVTMTNCER